MDFERRNLVLYFTIFAVAAVTGFAIGQQGDSYQRPELYNSDFNLTVDSDTAISEVNFDNNTISLLFEDGEVFEAYIDRNNDGSGDKRLNKTVGSSSQTTSELLTLNGKSYRLYFEYLDRGNVSEGDYLQLYRIERLQ